MTAETLEDAAAIVSYTISGATAGRVSRERPYIPVMCMTPDESVARKMSLFWGIESVVCEPMNLLVDVARRASDYCQDLFGAKVGEKIIMTAGLPFNVTGNTNLLHIFSVMNQKSEK